MTRVPSLPLSEGDEMSTKSGLGVTMERFEKLLDQAKDSVKVLEALQKEGISRAKNYIHFPDEKIAAALRKMGFATKEDLRELNDRMEDLASELRSQISKLNKKNKE